MRREQAIAAIDGLGPEFDLDTLVERLIFVEKIEEGLRDMREGRTISNEEMKAYIQQLKAEGRAQATKGNAA